MHVERAQNDSLLEIRATQVLNPGEKLLWVGKHDPWNRSYIIPILIIGLVVPACLRNDFAQSWWQYLAIAIVFSLYFGFMVFGRDRDTVLALTDCRLLIVLPGNTIWWRSIKDVKAMEARIKPNGSGKLRFKFDKAELGFSHRGKEQRHVSSLDLTFPILQNGESLKQLVDLQLSKAITEQK